MKKQVLVIDNYDSFVYNLVQYLGELDCNPIVKRNDEVSIKNILSMDIDAIVISPGPGTPKDAGISNKVIELLAGELPILGVCLGHQCIAEVFGGQVIQAGEIVHGKTSPVFHQGQGILAGLKNPFDATRYHSLMVSKENFPKELEITAETSNGIIMALRHKNLAVEGVQFHPESILTDVGHQILANFLGLVHTKA